MKVEAIVLAAGLGTRMKSAVPKVLHRVAGLTLLERVVAATVELNPARICVIAGHGLELVQTEVERLRQRFPEISLDVVVQEEQKGTGHAARLGLASCSKNSRVLILPGDVPLITGGHLQKLVAAAENADAALAFLTCVHQEPAFFGRVVRSPRGEVQKIVEFKDCSPQEKAISEINTSIYYGRAEFLSEALALLGTDNAQNEYYLTDIVSYGVEKGLKVIAEITGDSIAVSGVNNRLELSEIERKRRRQINERHMLAGVTFEDPDNTYVDELVEVGPDCFIGAGCRLKGRTTIEANVVLDGNSFVESSVIEQGARIKANCVISEAHVGRDCQIGPFAHLRPGSLLHEQVHIGNFVETKKTEMHKGAKANHLTYLGDSEVGARSNIGAGTITCNYDGVHKHRTTIGEHCFVGSNTALVAPITVGAGAYIGAGSTVTRDVPPKSLAVARAAQRNIEGWVERKTKKKED